jgi:hypothetical protein
MPEHVLPVGRELIAALGKLGEALGYAVETEFPIDREKPHTQAIDVAWMRDQEQRFPLMVFEVESTASNAAANNPLKLYSKRQFEKPLFFFHVFVDAGRDTSRLQDLTEEYGRMNYRTYTLSHDGPEALVGDILAQHRRLTDRLDVVAFVETLRESCLNAADYHSVLVRTESLGFNSGRGTTLPSYAVLGAAAPEFLSDFQRYLVARRTGNAKREVDRYPSYFGENWVTPLHLGVLSSLQPAPSSPQYFDAFRRWHEEPGGPALRIGPWFGLNMDFDDFLAYYSAPFFALLAALMADVAGAVRYFAGQLGTVFGEVRADRLAVRSHIASWVLHLYAVDAHAQCEFEVFRERVNADGGLAGRFLWQPYGGVPFAHLDPVTDAAFSTDRVAVPSFEEFRSRLRAPIDAATRRQTAARLALRLLCTDETMIALGEELLPLLHGTSDGHQEATS